jgi:hypothetical protein
MNVMDAFNYSTFNIFVFDHFNHQTFFSFSDKRLVFEKMNSQENFTQDPLQYACVVAGLKRQQQPDNKASIT